MFLPSLIFCSARFDECVEAFEKAKQDSKSASQAFHECQELRRKLFMDAFNHVAGEIDEIYKSLTKSEKFPLGGTAYLNVESIERPYEQGVKFHAMPPMKRFRDMEQLSGGEKTVAALALLFAIHAFKPSPFFVLDEIDAALDAANVSKVSNYIRSRSQHDGLQCIVISLKDSFYQKADALVGVYKDLPKQTSATLTLDLSQYADDD
jgi:structural maintenance of chromosome 1